MSRTTLIGVAIGFFVLTFSVYGLSLGNGFVAWDDNFLIVSNAIIKGFSWDHLVNAFTTYDPELYDPLVFVMYQCIYTIGGLSAPFFHAANLILHTLNALGVCIILFSLTKKKWIGIVGGLLFAVHPLNTEAVSWAAALKDVQSTFFFLFSIVAYLRYRDESDRRGLFYGISLGLFVLGLLSKVMVLSLPAVLILLDMLARRRWTKDMVLEKIPFAALSVMFGIIAIFGKQLIVRESTLLEKILMAAKSTMFYIGSYIWPVHLSVLYPYSKPITLASPDFLIPVSLVAVLIVVMILAFQKLRAVSIGIAFYVITLFPTFFNFAKGGYFYVASDRYAYIPQIGLLLIILTLIDHFFERSSIRQVKKYGYTIIAVLLCILSALTVQQSLTWKNSETLFLQTLTYHPDAQAARLNLGYVYRESELYDKAIEQFNFAIAREPKNALAYANLGLVYEKQGKTAEAIDAYKKGIELNPLERDSFMSLGMLYERLGRVDDALAQYQKVQEMQPLYAPVYNNLGSVYMQKNDQTSARTAYEKAIEINPYYADAHFNLAYIEAKEGKLDAAAEEYETTLSLEGDKVETLTTLASLYAELNKTEETVRTLQRILKIDPQDEFALKLLNALKQNGLVQ